MSRVFNGLTIAVTALGAIAFLSIPYGFAAYPGQFFADAGIGKIPLWVICVFSGAVLAAVSVGTAWKRSNLPRV